MILPLFLITAAITVLSAIEAVKGRKQRRLMALLCLVAALPTALLGFALFGGTRADPDAPRDTVTAFFTSVQEMNFSAANELLMNSEALSTEGLSEDTQLLLFALCHCLQAEPVGDPIIDGFTASQTVQLTAADLPSVMNGIEERAYSLLSDMMLTREKAELFTADDSAYSDAVKQEVFEQVFTALVGTAENRTETTLLNITLFWTPFGWYIRPDTALLAAVTGCGDTEAEPSLQALDQAVSDTYTKLYDTLPVLNKIYTLDRTITAGPKPDPNGFHSTTDPQEVAAVVEDAAVLLDGQTVSWSPDLELMPGSEIQYYYDDSILVIVWQEVHDDCVVTFSEVKLAHASQFFRYLCGGTYQYHTVEDIWETPTVMAQRSNSVVAITGDFYRRRDVGTMVYQGTLYRNDPYVLDTCFFDSDGNMHMIERRKMNKMDFAQLVKTYDYQFAVSFGPILIKDGVLFDDDWYPIGETKEYYDRCAIGQIDDLHYMLITAGHTSEYKAAPLVVQVANYLYEKGCVQAYTLDGGQTGSLVFNGTLINQINYGGERTSSDMLCFVSAIPEDER